MVTIKMNDRAHDSCSKSVATELIIRVVGSSNRTRPLVSRTNKETRGEHFLELDVFK